MDNRSLWFIANQSSYSLEELPREGGVLSKSCTLVPQLRDFRKQPALGFVLWGKRSCWAKALKNILFLGWWLEQNLAVLASTSLYENVAFPAHSVIIPEYYKQERESKLGLFKAIWITVLYQSLSLDLQVHLVRYLHFKWMKTRRSQFYYAFHHQIIRIVTLLASNTSSLTFCYLFPKLMTDILLFAYDNMPIIGNTIYINSMG